jgi:hypothetical protein
MHKTYVTHWKKSTDVPVSRDTYCRNFIFKQYLINPFHPDSVMNSESLKKNKAKEEVV